MDVTLYVFTELSVGATVDAPEMGMALSMFALYKYPKVYKLLFAKAMAFKSPDRVLF